MLMMYRLCSMKNISNIFQCWHSFDNKIQCHNSVSDIYHCLRCSIYFYILYTGQNLNLCIQSMTNRKLYIKLAVCLHLVPRQNVPTDTHMLYHCMCLELGIFYSFRLFYKIQQHICIISHSIADSTDIKESSELK